MYKDELIGLHQLLYHICKLLQDNGVSLDDFQEYMSLEISPHHIHKRKEEHKCAVLLLSKCISKALAEHYIMPKALPKSFDTLAQRCKKEAQKAIPKS